MFSKSKHAIGKKCKKVMTAALTFALLCGFTGCAKEETGSSAPQSTAARSSSSVKQSVPNNNSEVPQSSAVSSDNTVSSDTQSEQSAVKTEFDFDEAVKNISLFGHKISLPCYWSDFDEDFSHDDMYFESDDGLMCSLRYKGKKIGSILFGNCVGEENTDKIEHNPVMLIIIGFTNYGYPYNSSDSKYFESTGYYTELLELNLDGVSMSSTEKDITAKFGEPSKITEGGGLRFLDYKYDNGYFHFVIDKNKMTNGSMELYIYVN